MTRRCTLAFSIKVMSYVQSAVVLVMPSLSTSRMYIKIAFKPQHACTVRVAVIGYVCLSVDLYLDCQMSVKTMQTCNDGQKIKRFFSENVLFLLYGVICLPGQCVWCYFVFVITEASLLAGKANDILSILKIPVNECRRQQAISLHAGMQMNRQLINCTCIFCTMCEIV